MDFLVEFLREIAFLLCEAAPYLLVGFFLAGLMKVFLPERKVYQHLGENRFKSVFLASLYGVPLPLCSCSVIPTAVSLKKSGASKGATAAFMISTPETGVDSISVTWALLDPIMTVVRPLAAFVSAMATGAFVTVMTRKGWDGDEEADIAALEARAAEDHEHEHGEHADRGRAPDDDPAAAGSGGAGATCCAHEEPPKPTWRERFGQARQYAFGTLLDDLTPWFLIGFTLSGIIAVLLPDNLFTELVTTGWASMLLMLVLGTPIYICATASTPIAATLIAKGMDPGAALVFLLVGPATNVTTLLVVNKLLGRRTLVIYLVSITSVAIGAGVFVNSVYASLGTDLSTVVAESMAMGRDPISIASGVIFAALLVVSARRIRLFSLWGRQLRGLLRPIGVDPTTPAFKGALVLAGLLVWASSAVTFLGPGETGWVVRFGEVQRTIDAPGAYYHWPAPIDRVVRVRPDEVQSVEVGFGYAEAADDVPLSQRKPLSSLELDAEAEMMTGDENLVAIAYSVHYRMKDPFAARFSLVDPEAVTKAFAESAIRQVVARGTASELLVAGRKSIETSARATLQGELDGIGSGLQVVAFHLRDVHAPPDVHYAYRDVASALEDIERHRHDAEGFQAELVARAGSQAYVTRTEAAGESESRLAVASGEAFAFAKKLEAFRMAPEITRTRLWLQSVERALGRTRTVFLLGPDVAVDLLNAPDGALGLGALDDPRGPDPVDLEEYR